MCGFTGFIDSSSHNGGQAILRKMTRTLVHRGPDDVGYWFENLSGLAMGFRRLSVVDLSQSGHQPMHSPCGRYVISFNGEIYNYRTVMRSLSKAAPHLLQGYEGHSDTFFLLAAISHYGVEKALKKVIGMYAFALWDKETEQLTLVRDRCGEKPLYYGWAKGSFLFGSELKALKQHPSWEGVVDPHVVSLYLHHNYIPTPYSIFKGIYKLPAGSYLTLDIATLKSEGCDFDPHFAAKSYWDRQKMAARRLNFSSDAQAVKKAEVVLKNAVKLQMEADVPLGAFLSGGIDSSLIVALMKKLSSQSIKTFSIGFSESFHNEAKYAKQIADWLGTEHRELYVPPKLAQSILPKLPELYDEPFSDPSQIPTFLLSDLAKKEVTVSLSGDGADEIFGGYTRYLRCAQIWSLMGRIPFDFRRMLSVGIGKLPGNLLGNALTSGQRLRRLSEIVGVRDLNELYAKYMSHGPHIDRLLSRKSNLPLWNYGRETQLSEAELTEQMMYWDLGSFLPDHILVKVDRAAMGVSLETRTPYLDHRVVEFAWGLAPEFKFRKGVGKWILRQVLAQYVPAKFFDRPKHGFGMPIESWLRGPLREWGEDLLAPQKMKEQGYFVPEEVWMRWDQHQSGSHNWQYLLWDILMFQSWLTNQQA